MSYADRRWRELGEQPIFWSKLNLKFHVFKEGRGSDQWVVPFVPDNCGWTEELAKVLTLPRLQSLSS